ncbi:MAG: 3,4-dihydroxy-2-butanone-4-phosphate synthase, partial [Archaeoglobaceae archaeon]
QTKVSVALAEMAGIAPAVAICEMLDSETGKALSKEKAMEFAEERNIPFVEGKDVVKHYKEFREIKAKIFI